MRLTPTAAIFAITSTAMKKKQNKTSKKLLFTLNILI